MPNTTIISEENEDGLVLAEAEGLALPLYRRLPRVSDLVEAGGPAGAVHKRALTTSVQPKNHDADEDNLPTISTVNVHSMSTTPCNVERIQAWLIKLALFSIFNAQMNNKLPNGTKVNMQHTIPWTIDETVNDMAVLDKIVEPCF
uniref:Uncharacterized protein n=1 Tax=Panagrellus redivivus TaxID=6233 RepID=A0A7E5A1W7_PANRE